MAKKTSEEMRRLERHIRQLKDKIKEYEDNETEGIENTVKSLKEELDLREKKLKKLKEEEKLQTSITEKSQKRKQFVEDIGKGILQGNLNLTKVLQSQIKLNTTVGKGLNLFLELSTQAVKLDTTFSDIARSLDVSIGEAREFAVETKNTSEFAGLAGNTYIDLARTIHSIREEFGFITDSLQEESQLLSVVSKNLNLSAKDAGKFSLYSQISGTNVKDMSKAIVRMTKDFPILNKIGIRFRSIIEEITSLSKDTLALFAGHSDQLLKSAVGARMLGINLSQAHDIGRKLLDIEGSLTAEAEARVLTGQQLNFDQARYLAVTKDVQAASEYILKQVGGIQKFSELNLLAQESIAQAIGISVGDLAEALTKQKALARLGEDQVAQLREMSALEAERLITTKGISDESLKAYIRGQTQLGVQERFNDLVLQLQQIAVTTLVPLLQLLTPILESVGTFLNALASNPVLRVLTSTAIGAGIGAATAGPIGALVGGGVGLVGSIYNESQESGLPGLAEGGLAFAPTQVTVGDNPQANTDPEVIAPLSKLEEYTSTDTRKIEQLLQELISIVKRPAVMQVDRKFAGEVYQLGQLQNTYNIGFETRGGSFS